MAAARIASSETACAPAHFRNWIQKEAVLKTVTEEMHIVGMGLRVYSASLSFQRQEKSRRENQR